MDNEELKPLRPVKLVRVDDIPDLKKMVDLEDVKKYGYNIKDLFLKHKRLIYV